MSTRKSKEKGGDYNMDLLLIIGIICLVMWARNK